MSNKSKIDLVIIGTGGFAREVLWTIRDYNEIHDEFSVLGFLDDDESTWGQTIDGIKVLGNTDYIFSQKNEIKCVIGISNTKIRKKIVQKLEKEKISFQTIIHPSVIFSKTSKIGNGTVIQAGSIITTNVVIGNHVHINMDTTVAHNSIIQNFATLSPGVHVNGNTIVEEGVFIGSGAVIKQNLKIGKWSIVGAGTVLLTNVEDHSMYVGVPGKLKKNRKDNL
jgi:sugar O-acyltransferase (sialic acid O-acetyltransferase NeuD family)